MKITCVCFLLRVILITGEPIYLLLYGGICPYLLPFFASILFFLIKIYAFPYKNWLNITTIYKVCFCNFYYFFSHYLLFLKRKKTTFKKNLFSLVSSCFPNFLSSVLSNLKVDTFLLSLWCAYWDKNNPTLVLWINI